MAQDSSGVVFQDHYVFFKKLRISHLLFCRSAPTLYVADPFLNLIDVSPRATL